MANTPKDKKAAAQAAEPEAEELKERSFQLVKSAPDDEDAVTRVSVGADPRISIGAGEKFATTDQRLADQLAAHPELEEVTR